MLKVEIETCLVNLCSTRTCRQNLQLKRTQGMLVKILDFTETYSENQSPKASTLMLSKSALKAICGIKSEAEAVKNTLICF